MHVCMYNILSKRTLQSRSIKVFGSARRNVFIFVRSSVFDTTACAAARADPVENPLCLSGFTKLLHQNTTTTTTTTSCRIYVYIYIYNLLPDGVLRIPVSKKETDGDHPLRSADNICSRPVES